MVDRLHRFQIGFAGKPFDLRVACHPSESMRYFVSRILAYVLHFEPGLVFSRGVCVGEEPALFTPSGAGRQSLWIDVGRPDRKKLVQGLRKAERVIVYGYGNQDTFRKSLNVKGAERLLVYWLPTGFLDRLAAAIEAGTTHWRLSLHENTITVNGIGGTRTRLL